MSNVSSEHPFSNGNITNTLLFSVEKCENPLQRDEKDSHILSTKITVYLAM